MNLTIINEDNAVYVDGIVLVGLNLTLTGIPDNVHALQWKTNLGWIEYKENDDFTKPANDILNALPHWANNCVSVYNNKIAELEEQQRNAIQPVSIGTQTL
jgi:hypothetical protein